MEGWGSRRSLTSSGPTSICSPTSPPPYLPLTSAQVMTITSLLLLSSSSSLFPIQFADSYGYSLALTIVVPCRILQRLLVSTDEDLTSSARHCRPFMIRLLTHFPSVPLCSPEQAIPIHTACSHCSARSDLPTCPNLPKRQSPSQMAPQPWSSLIPLPNGIPPLL